MSIDVIREDIRAIQAYAVPVLDNDMIKLDAMEVPYLLPENLHQELAEQLISAPINRYPNPASSGLQDALRLAFPIPSDAHIALGNGSDELIQFITLLVAKPDAVVLSIEPTFVMYQRNAELFGMKYVSVPLNEDFSLNMDAVLSAIQEHQPVLTFIAYPNNPTGVAYQRDQVEKIIQAATGLVVIDEAYGAFSHDSFLPQAGQPEHLLVLRTLSKIGFAGLRVGYVSGSPAVIDELAKIVPPYNMNQLSLTAAKFALQHIDAVNENIALLTGERERLQQTLAKLPDVKVFNSAANFVTVRLPKAEQAFETLKQNKILVKKLSGSHTLLDNCLRLTVGKPDENDKVLTVLTEHCQQCVANKQVATPLMSSLFGKNKAVYKWLTVGVVFALIAMVVAILYFA